jgi:hypothetical protein
MQGATINLKYLFAHKFRHFFWEDLVFANSLPNYRMDHYIDS